MTTLAAKLKLEPLKVTCTSTDCDNGLHCFLASKRMRQRNEGGACRACGARLVDWQRVHGRELADAAHTFAALQHELIRHHYFHLAFDECALNHARRKGKAGLRRAAHQRIRTALRRGDNPYDGRQTPLSGNVLYYAQHATATCCRKCAEEWHGIPQGRELTEAELAYLGALVELYLDLRLPELSEQAERIPARRPAAEGNQVQGRTRAARPPKHASKAPDSESDEGEA